MAIIFLPLFLLYCCYIHVVVVLSHLALEKGGVDADPLSVVTCSEGVQLHFDEYVLFFAVVVVDLEE